MKIIKLKLKASKDSCIGCCFLKEKSKEIGYNSFYKYTICDIFKSEISRNKPCVACKSLEVEE